MQILYLHKNQERRLLAGHLWVYSNEVNQQHSLLKTFQLGELVLVKAHNGRELGIGYVNPHCLLVARILVRDSNTKIDKKFFIQRFEVALKKRQWLFQQPYYRLVFGESDGLPGLVVDRFEEIFIIQINTAGMEALKPFIIAAITELFQPTLVVLHCESAERKLEGLECYCEVVVGTQKQSCLVKENDCDFHFPLLTGQKTGWFYDHRASRAQIARYCQGKKVLDMFSYLGAFGIPCAKSQAQSVICVDSSSSAIAQLNENASLNKLDNVTAYCADGFDFLHEQLSQREKFDVIILDPPAFIKRKKDFDAGFSAYLRLNQLALQLLNPNGILLSASCSMHLSSAQLLDIIRRAALKTKREVSVLEQCHQAADHPVHPAILETNYLKGFILHAG